MAGRIAAWGAAPLLAVLGLSMSLLAARPAHAVPKAKARPAVQSKPPKKKAQPAPHRAATRAPATKAAPPVAETDATPNAAEVAVKGAVTPPSPAPAAAAIETKESKEGVKTYKFGTIEVEGRLKSPQIIYFMRRVRAEFDAGLLGHRSFLRELADTRNDPVLR